MSDVERHDVYRVLRDSISMTVDPYRPYERDYETYDGHNEFHSFTEVKSMTLEELGDEYMEMAGVSCYRAVQEVEEMEGETPALGNVRLVVMKRTRKLVDHLVDTHEHTWDEDAAPMVVGWFMKVGDRGFLVATDL